MVPKDILRLYKMREHRVVEVIDIEGKSSVGALHQLHIDPFENDVHNLLQILWLRADHLDEFLDALDMLLEVRSEHELLEVETKDLLTVFLEGFDLVFVELLMHPL